MPDVGQPGLSPGRIVEVVAAPVLGAVVLSPRLAGRIRRAARTKGEIGYRVTICPIQKMALCAI